ncbi:MAG: Co2+/Mg2+ efflux protein ApaG [Chloroflexaceae bacterium]|nr:Co2+/Mg2+ efflux protein ApaG [Chloroflexaceae bacterium]NJL33724.1 Co2+/Mg2+ efflux protein ApaG [Chloroflexaceae bacterium]
MQIGPTYSQETNGIRVTVQPMYLEDHSDPIFNHYVFVYAVRIENNGRKTMQLLSRRWLIHDSNGENHEVQGDGVVGEQPVLSSGDVHEYQSFCVLKSPRGYMEGSYRFIGRDDVIMEAQIPRFYLEADA